MRVVLLAITLSLGCAGRPRSAVDTDGASRGGAGEKEGPVNRDELLQELGVAAQEFVRTNSQGERHWHLVQRVLKSGALVGLTKGQITARLGESRRCPRGMGDAQQRGSWACYPIGKLDPGSYGGTIELGVQFGNDGLSISTDSQRME